MAAKIKPDETKLAELILYVCQKCAEDPCFGAVKLNKILYFADFMHYGDYGVPITGVEYQKLPHGPAPRRLLPVRAKMEKNGDLGVQPVRLMSGYTQKKPVNLRDADLSKFSGKEIATIDAVIEALREHDTDTVSEISHRMAGWQMMDEGDVIPYQTVFVSNPPLSASEIKRGEEIARKHALASATA